LTGVAERKILPVERLDFPFFATEEYPCPYLRRLANHRGNCPEVVGIRAVDGLLPSTAARGRADDWAEIGQCVAEEFDVDIFIHDAESFTAAMNEVAGAAA